MACSGTSDWLRRMILGGELFTEAKKVADAVGVSRGAPSDGDEPPRRSRRRATEATIIDTTGQDTTSQQSPRPGEPCGTEAGSARPCWSAADAVREAPWGAGERSERAGEREDHGPVGPKQERSER